MYKPKFSIVPNQNQLRTEDQYSFYGKIQHGYHVAEENLVWILHRIWTNLRKPWVAFKYQFHRYTFGLFQEVQLSWQGKMVVVALGVVVLHKSGYINSSKNSDGFFLLNDHTSSLGLSSLAPTPAGSMSEREVREYVQRFGKVAVTEMHEYGVPASISMAQGLIESASGNSTLAKENNNHFGIKCFDHKCPKGHCVNRTDDSHKDFFRNYSTAWESWRAHSQMLSRGRYQALHRNETDFKRWAYGLQSAGYATEGDYANLLIEIIERYELNRLDEM